VMPKIPSRPALGRFIVATAGLFGLRLVGVPAPTEYPEAGPKERNSKAEVEDGCEAR
jgi:hypothetical protein